MTSYSEIEASIFRLIDDDRIHMSELVSKKEFMEWFVTSGLIRYKIAAVMISSTN